MKSKFYRIVLTAREGVSHHDPSAAEGCNITTFNRQAQFVSRPSGEPVYTHLVEEICRLNPMPDDQADLLGEVCAPEWLAAAYIRLLLDIYNSGDGQGLLSGPGRYQMLENRVQAAAQRSCTLRSLWSLLTDDMQLDTHPMEFDSQIASFWTLPPNAQYHVLDALVKGHRAVVTMARLWHTSLKERSLEYMEALGKAAEWREKEMITASFGEAQFPKSPEKLVMQVPVISVNGLRHQMVREPAYLHLCDSLGVTPAARGEGPFPIGADAIFYNGGNIQKGAKQPDNAFFLAGQIRKAYPSLDLVGGTTSSFDLGESRLRMSAWIVCLENADNLPDEIRAFPQAQTSVFDMLDTVTRTRKASADGVGQMIFNYETLAAGSQVYVELTLNPYTPAITSGALAAALTFYSENVGVVGGQSARGNGHVYVQFMNGLPEGVDEYEEYLASNKEALRDGITSGKLCSDSVVVW